MNNKGFTLIEILLALLIGCITAACIASYISFLAGLNNRMKLRRASGEAIHAMAESIRFNLSLFQVTYDNSNAKEEEMLAPAALPLAVASNTIVPRSTCGTGTPMVRCTAYVGYIIVPSEIIRNLYQVKFLAVSTDKEAKWKTDFTYFITVK
jgi:prepilin-type N-terminal cleavage/methylation domain-containing protein